VLSSTATQAYWDRLRKGQKVSLGDIEAAAQQAGEVRITRVPMFDTELRNVYALRVLGDTLTQGGVGPE
jgi:hypothetical protein